jgi:hypothetical protein
LILNQISAAYNGTLGGVYFESGRYRSSLRYFKKSITAAMMQMDFTTAYDHEKGEPFKLLGTDRFSYYFKDHPGSIRRTIDENNNLKNAQDYLPFGTTRYTFLFLSFIDYTFVNNKLLSC